MSLAIWNDINELCYDDSQAAVEEVQEVQYTKIQEDWKFLE